jgi:hypothetical protein
VKSFFKRFEIGSDIQTQKSNRFFPSTTDLGGSIAYKVTDQFLLGLGVSSPKVRPVKLELTRK